MLLCPVIGVYVDPNGVDEKAHLTGGNNLISMNTVIVSTRICHLSRYLIKWDVYKFEFRNSSSVYKLFSTLKNIKYWYVEKHKNCSPIGRLVSVIFLPSARKHVVLSHHNTN